MKELSWSSIHAWEDDGDDPEEAWMAGGRTRWACEPPGPKGSGVEFNITEVAYRWDGVRWSRIIYAWVPAGDPAAPPAA